MSLGLGYLIPPPALPTLPTLSPALLLALLHWVRTTPPHPLPLPSPPRPAGAIAWAVAGRYPGLVERLAVLAAPQWFMYLRNLTLEQAARSYYFLWFLVGGPRGVRCVFLGGLGEGVVAPRPNYNESNAKERGEERGGLAGLGYGWLLVMHIAAYQTRFDQ